MYQKTTLDNGLRIVTSAMPHTRSVCINFFIGTGSRYETPEEAGVSHFIEHLCFKGTNRRPTSKEISEAIEGVGGILNGGTDKELTMYWCKVARPHFSLAQDILEDMLRHSKLDPAAIEKERSVIIEELNAITDSPHQRVDVLIDEVVWPNQALGRDVAGTKDTVSAITRQMITDYLIRQYLPSNTVISIAGDITHEEVVQSLAKVFGDWQLDGTPQSWFPADDSQNAPRLCLEPKKTEEAHLCLGVRGLSSIHPDRFVLDLLNVILGEGMSSRLFLEIREKHGLAYDICSYVSHFLDSGCLTIYAGVDPKRAEGAISAILGQLNLLNDEIPETELTKAKELSKGRLLLRMEDTRSVASWIGSQELLRKQILTVDEVISIIDAITTQDLRRVAKELLVTEKLNLAIVGPFRSESRFVNLLKL